MTGTLTLLDAVDDLYREVVEDPESWAPERLAEWAEDLGTGDVTRDQARLLRRCMRVAAKLQRYWAAPVTPLDGADWRSRVDIALGPPAWRPTLDLALLGLDGEPSPEVFDQVAARFRVVHSHPFLDGIDYPTWLETGGAARSAGPAADGDTRR